MKKAFLLSGLLLVFLFSAVAVTYSATVTKETKSEVKTETNWTPEFKVCDQNCEYVVTEWKDRCPHEGEYQVRTCKIHESKQKRYRFDLDERLRE